MFSQTTATRTIPAHPLGGGISCLYASVAPLLTSIMPALTIGLNAVILSMMFILDYAEA